MNSLEAGAEDFGGDGAGAGDEGTVSFQASFVKVSVCLPVYTSRNPWLNILGTLDLETGVPDLQYNVVKQVFRIHLNSFKHPEPDTQSLR